MKDLSYQTEVRDYILEKFGELKRLSRITRVSYHKIADPLKSGAPNEHELKKIHELAVNTPNIQLPGEVSGYSKDILKAKIIFEYGSAYGFVKKHKQVNKSDVSKLVNGHVRKSTEKSKLIFSLAGLADLIEP